jgi:hypothetical protein
MRGQTLSNSFRVVGILTGKVDCILRKLEQCN